MSDQRRKEREKDEEVLTVADISFMPSEKMEVLSAAPCLSTEYIHRPRVRLREAEIPAMVIEVKVATGLGGEGRGISCMHGDP